MYKIFLFLLVSVSVLFSNTEVALKGKFKVKNGNAIYKIPIDKPKIRGNLEFDLSILYNSAKASQDMDKKDGILGRGFSLGGFSNIYYGKSNLKGNKIVNLFSGERLVGVPDNDNDIATNEYRTERNIFSRIYNTWEEYRYIGHGYYDVMVKKFRVHSKNGREYYYEEVIDSTNIFRIKEIKDKQDNKIEFFYNSNFTINKIKYQNTTITFQYEDRPKEDITFLFLNLFHNPLGLKDVRLKKRVNKITVLNNNQVYSSYEIKYRQLNEAGNYSTFYTLRNASYISEIKKCYGENNCLMPLKFDQNKFSYVKRVYNHYNEDLDLFYNYQASMKYPDFYTDDLNGLRMHGLKRHIVSYYTRLPYGKFNYRDKKVVEFNYNYYQKEPAFDIHYSPLEIPARTNYETFKEIMEYDERTQTKTISKFRLDYPFTGLLSEKEIRIKDKLISLQKFEYEDKSLLKNERIYNPQVVKKTIESYDYNSEDLLSTKTITYEGFDKEGNIGKIIASTIGTDGTNTKQTTVNTYTNIGDSWITKLASKTVIYQHGSDIKVQKFEYEYYEDDANFGLLKNEIVEPDNEKQKLITYYEYDKFGNKVLAKISGQDIQTQTTTYGYDSNGINQISSTNPLGHIITKKYNEQNLLEYIIDENGLKTSFKYDIMKRKVKEIRADKTVLDWKYKIHSLPAVWELRGISIEQFINNIFVEKITYNGFNKIVEKEKPNIKGSNFKEKFNYDTLQRLAIEQDTSKYYDKKTSYDELSRVKKIETGTLGKQYYVHYQDEEGNFRMDRKEDWEDHKLLKEYVYNKQNVVEIDAKGNSTVTTYNAINQIVKIEKSDSEISYDYDALGNLISIIDSAGNISISKYDNLGNKISQNDPDLGEWFYTYYSNGKLKKQKDAKGQLVSFTYDKLGRVKTKSTSEGVIEYIYDIGNKAIGKISEEIGIGVRKKYEYNNFSQLQKVITYIDNIEYVKEYKYDEQGRVSKVIEPNGIELYNTYENSYLKSIYTSSHHLLTPLKRKNKLLRKEISELNKKSTISNNYIIYEDLAETYKNDVISTYWGELYKIEFIEQLRDNSNSLEEYKEVLKKIREGYLLVYSDYYSDIDIENDRYGVNYAIDDISQEEFNLAYPEVDYAFINSFDIYAWENFPEILEVFESSESELSPEQILGSIAPDLVKIYELLEDGNEKFYYERTSTLEFYLKNMVQNNASEELREKISILEAKIKLNEEKITELEENSRYYIYIAQRQENPNIVNQYKLGNNSTTTLSFQNDYNMLSLIQTTSKIEKIDNIQFYTYFYDEVGNLKKVNDDVNSIMSSYEYDDLNRLINAKKSYFHYYSNPKSINYSIDYEYDAIGNIISKSDVGSYEYNSSLPHAVTQIGNRTFDYDENGNIVHDGNYSISYNSSNLPILFQNNTNDVKFHYDVNNQRYKKETNSKKIHYIDSTFEREFMGDEIIDRNFIYANGKVIAILETKDNISDIKFLHHDNLGSVDTITDISGGIIQRFSYKPFGKQFVFTEKGIADNTSLLKINRGFTGHESIEEIDLIHMNGRVYNSSIGRFLSADPTIPYLYDTQSHNRYSYTRNNPLKYIDPSGFTDEEVDSFYDNPDSANPFYGDSFFDEFSDNTNVFDLMGEDSLHSSDIDLYDENIETTNIFPAVPYIVVVGGGAAIKWYVKRLYKNSSSKKIKKRGRTGKQKRLKEIMIDEKEASRFRGWIKQEINQIKRGKRTNIRNPIGYDLAHKRGKEAFKGYGYEHSNLLDKKLHRLQHKYDNYGRKR